MGPARLPCVVLRESSRMTPDYLSTYCTVVMANWLSTKTKEAIT